MNINVSWKEEGMWSKKQVYGIVYVLNFHMIFGREKGNNNDETTTTEVHCIFVRFLDGPNLIW